MNRFLHSRNALCACSLILTLGLIAVAAGAEPMVVPRPAKPLIPQAVNKNGQSSPNQAGPLMIKQKYRPGRVTVPKELITPAKYDLKVSEFSGFKRGEYYYFVAKIKNVGQIAYPRGRYAVVFCSGSAHMHRREPIPPLQPGEEHTIPGFRIEVGRLTPTNHFIVELTDEGPRLDTNPNNDRKETDAFELVR